MASKGFRIRINAIEAHMDAKTINSIITEVMGKRVTSITQDPDLRQDIGTAYVAQTSKYVPMSAEGGKLRMSGHAEKDGRVYWTAIDPRNGYNYAMVQYRGGYTTATGQAVIFKDYTTPGTGANWDAAMRKNSWPDFIADITPLIKRRFEDGSDG